MEDIVTEMSGLKQERDRLEKAIKEGRHEKEMTDTEASALKQQAIDTQADADKVKAECDKLQSQVTEIEEMTIQAGKDKSKL